MEAQPTVIP